MTFDLGILGATIVSRGIRHRNHLYVQDGAIAAITDEELDADRVIDASGLFLVAGVIDGHLHFQEPGDTTREDFVSGSMSAALGGVTTVIEHTHSDPVRSVEFLREKIELHRGRSIVDFGLAAHAWPEDVDHLEPLWRAGVQFFKIFTCTTHGVPAQMPGHLLRTFQRLASLDALTLVHCEDESITSVNELELKRMHRKDAGLLPLWRSREAEQVASVVVGQLARLAGNRTIVAHVSQPAILDYLDRERTCGARLWVETCPQYLYLRESEIPTHGPFRKCTPPPRGDAEASGLWEGLLTGTITHVSSDHAPSTRDQKLEGRDDIWQCHFGLPGVQTSLPLMLHAVAQGRLRLEDVVRLMCEHPAMLYRLWPRKGSLEPGSDADVVLVDMEARDVIRADTMASKAGWTPYEGKQVQGKVVMTILGGTPIVEEGRYVGAGASGSHIPGPGART